MPWRDDPSPYKTWVSEIMLQQTQVATVIPYFNRFIRTFPSIQALADADMDALLKQWEGLGYYSRARNLKKTAKLVCEDFGGKLPENYNDLQCLPGIGPYCAAAITSIAFGHPVPVVDGNVLRVFSRFWGIFDDIRLKTVRDTLFLKLERYIQDANPADFNQAMMECGALICTPKSPSCQDCPLHRHCFAYQFQKTEQLPFKSKLAPAPHHTIGIGIIFHQNKIFISKRREEQMLGGLWEFPGGKKEKKESIRETVRREIKEETQLDVVVETKLCEVKHAYSHFKITLHAYFCTLLDREKKLLPLTTESLKVEAEEYRWVELEKLENFAFPTANKKVIHALKKKALMPSLLT